LKKILITIIVIHSFFFSFKVFSTEIKTETNTENLYKDIQPSIFRIHVIDNYTRKKVSAGSAFQINKNGIIATNYHVISDAIKHPDIYQIKYIAHDKSEGEARIISIDIINDLALLVHDNKKLKSFIPLNQSPLKKGAEIYSLGNLHDKGIIIVKGLYNGFIEKSWYSKMLFSGSLNPGMSGGPAINKNKEVIGINVSTQGNNVSFIVPVSFLTKLLNNDLQEKQNDWNSIIENQLKKNMSNIINNITKAKWETIEFGESLIPGEVVKSFTSWGETKEISEQNHKYQHLYVGSEESIYIDSEIQTGNIIFGYLWLTGLNGLNSYQFYTLCEDYYAPHYFNNISQNEATNFVSYVNFIQIDNKPCKITLSFRPYKKFKTIYDIEVKLASLHKKNQMLIAKLNVMGITRQDAFKLLEKFLKSIKWKS